MVSLTLAAGCLAAQRDARQGTIEAPIKVDAEAGTIEAATSQPVTQGDDSEAVQQNSTGWITLTNQTKAAGVTGFTFALIMVLFQWMNHREKMQMIARVNQEPSCEK